MDVLVWLARHASPAIPSLEAPSLEVNALIGIKYQPECSFGGILKKQTFIYFFDMRAQDLNSFSSQNC